MSNMLKKFKFLLLGAFLGALAGWAYWFFVGCSSGTCAITSKPLNSSLYGLFMGGLLGSMFKDEIQKRSVRKKAHQETNKA